MNNNFKISHFKIILSKNVNYYIITVNYIFIIYIIYIISKIKNI